MNLTAEQQRQLLLKMANDAAKAGVPADQIDAKLKAFSDRIEAGENVFAPVLERAKELQTAKKTFNKQAPWEPEVVKQANLLAMSPNKMYAEGYDPSKDVAATVEANKEADAPSGAQGFANSIYNAASTAGRTLLGAGAGVLEHPFVPESFRKMGQEEYFSAINAMREEEAKRGSSGASGLAGNVVGGLGTLGLGAISSGQDVIGENGTVNQAVGSTAIDALVNIASLATGKLLPGASVGKRMLAQGGASVAGGVAGRTAKNELLPNSMRQDVFDPAAIALEFGGGAAGGIVPDGAPAKSSIRTGDAAVDAGIAATEKLLGKKPNADIPKTEVDVTKPFKAEFTIPKTDYSVSPKERVNAEPFLEEPRRQAQIDKAYEQLRAERNATTEQAYRQKALSDAAIYQELPGIEPTAPVRGALDQEVPRGQNLSADQLSVLRDQLKQRQPAETATGPQEFSTSFAEDARNPAVPTRVGGINAPEVETLSAPKADVSQLQEQMNAVSKAASRKVSPSPDWSWNPKRPLDEQLTPESKQQLAAEKEVDLAQRVKEVEAASPFDGVPSKPMRMLGKLEDQTKAIARSPLPRVITDLYETGQLRSGDVLGSIMDDSQGLYKGADQFKALMSHLDSLGTKLGGLDTPIVRFDPTDARHAESATTLPPMPKESTGQAAGWYDPQQNTIYISSKEPSMATVVHEVTHGITHRIISMAEAGKLTGPARQAFAEFNVLFDSLKPKLDEMAGGDLRKFYGTTSLHEFMSEFYGSNTFRNHLKELKLTPEYVQTLGLGRMAVAKVKNMYQATVQFIRQSLGLPERAESAFDALFAASHKFTESVDDVQAKESREYNARGTKPMVVEKAGIPVPEIAKSWMKAAFLGDGAFPQIRQAKELSSGEKALGVSRSETMGNVYNKATKRMSPEQIKAVDEAMNVAITKSASKEGLEALKSVEKASPELGTLVREFASLRRNGDILYAKNILEDPNSTAAHKATAAVALDKADSYLVRAYDQNEFKNYGADKLSLAKNAEKKLEKGKEPTAREQKALDQTNALKAYLKKRYLPDNLDKLNSTQLEDLYSYYTGKQVQDIKPLEEFEGESPKAARKDWMRAEVAKELGKIGEADEAIKQMVDVIAGVNRSAPAARYFKNLREGSDVKSTLDHVPEEVRKFWGEVEKPIARMMLTVQNQAAINSQMNALASLRKEGMGTLFKEGKGHEGYTETLQGEKMGPLQGLSVKPEVKDALESFVQTGNFLGSWRQVFSGDPTGRGALAKGAVESFNAIKMFTSARKSAAVLGNFLGSSLRNGYGSFLQTAANGNFDFRTWAQGANDMKNLIGLSHRTKLDPQVEKLVKLKIAEASTLEETYSPAARRVIQKLMDTDGFRKPDTTAQKMNQALKDLGYTGQAGLKIAKEVYGAMDLWSKLANFRAEEAFWTSYNKKYGGIDDVAKFTADRINNTNITPGRAAPIAKGMDYVGASTFLPYTTEVARSLTNNVLYGISDIKQGLKLGRRELVRHGVARVMGSTGATLAGTKVLASMLAAGGATAGLIVDQMSNDSDRRKYLATKDFDAGSVPISIKDEAGKEYTLDAGMMNPYDPVARPINSVVKALFEKDPKQQDAALKEALKSTMGLIHQNGAWGYIMKAVSGDKPSLEKSNPAAYKDTLEVLVNGAGMSKQDADRAINLGMIVAPKGLLELYRGIAEETDPGIKAAIGSGIGVNRLDVTKDIENYEGPAFSSELLKAKKNYADLLKVDFDVDPKRVEKDFVQAIKDLAEPYNKMQLAVSAAREQGRTEKEIAQSLKLGRVNSKALDPIMKGESPPVQLIMADLKDDIRSDVAKDSSEETMSRARRNQALLRKLLNDYKDVTAQELVNGK